MKSLRQSIYTTEHTHLRQILIAQRKALGLSQRALAEKLGVVHSVIGKIETGDRRLDVIEFIDYCRALNLQPEMVLQQLY